MSLGAWIANYFTPGQAPHLAADGSKIADYDKPQHADHEKSQSGSAKTSQHIWHLEEVEEARPPYLQAMLAGGIGGTTGDMILHSLDTVKTRQQGDTQFPPRYKSLSSSYLQILRQEGVLRGLYGGVTPALLGSFPGTVIFFGIYEYSKRHMIDVGIPHSVAYLAGGLFADLAASVVYVPSEVLKTRLQLQGRYNNPFFRSGYNYRSTLDATRRIARQEGASALFYGYRATLFRDLPFSALQFAFYEKERKWAKQWVGSNEIGLPLEIITGATAGGMAGVITCPLDVVKTKIQTQINPDEEKSSKSSARAENISQATSKEAKTIVNRQSTIHRSIAQPLPAAMVPKRASGNLDPSSVVTGLKHVFKTEGVAGLFRGVGPRFVWTSIHSGTMFVLYQALLKRIDKFMAGDEEGACVN